MLINTKEYYQKNLSGLSEELNVKNKLALPRVDKVTISSGVGKIRANKDLINYVQVALGQISGQKPVSSNARKSVSTFKVREGDLVGFKVTLRNNKMYDFLNRLVNVTLPRIRDFQGIKDNQFDLRGNLTIGFKDQTAFVEVGQDSLDKPFGIGVTISVKNSNPQKSLALFRSMGFPLSQRLNKSTKTD